MADYFKSPGQSSGKLTRFYNGGNFSPDAVLFQEEQESAGTFWRYAFEMGNAYEALCLDVAMQDPEGEHMRLENFLGRFFVSDIKNLSFGESNGVPSHAEKIVRAIVSGMSADDMNRPEKNGGLLQVNKDGKEKKSPGYPGNKGNDLIRECVKNPGKIPMTQSDFKMLRDLSVKMCAMPLPQFWVEMWAPGSPGGTVGDFFRICEWQREIYWNENGVEKKAMPDCMAGYGGFGPMIDVKYSAIVSNFGKRLRSGYWIQDQHYQAGVRSLGLKPVPMLFVVGAPGDKSTPPTATAFMADPGERCTGHDRCFCESCRRGKYDQVSGVYYLWEKSGRGPRGYLPAVKEKVWV